MKIENISTDNSLCERITTSGLVSGYQRTNVTTSGTAIIETGESVLIPIIPLPSFNLPTFDDICKNMFSKIQRPNNDELMAQGYNLLKKENNELAEELFPVDIDKWPDWEN